MSSSFRDMTPAHIREPQGADYVEVVFLQSARIYRLFKKHRRFADISAVLEEAIVKKRDLQVRFEPPHGDVIEGVRLTPPWPDPEAAPPA